MPGQESDGQFDLPRSHGAEELRHQAALVEPTRRGLQPPTEPGEITEGRHPSILGRGLGPGERTPPRAGGGDHAASKNSARPQSAMPMSASAARTISRSSEDLLTC